MLHACFAPTILCFVYTLWHFYDFSGTNILRSATEPVSCFLLFFVSEKLVKKYSRNWTKKNPKFLFFPTRHGARRIGGDTPQGGHTWAGRSQGARRPRVWAPG